MGHATECILLIGQPTHCLVLVAALTTEQQVLLVLLRPACRGRDSEIGATQMLLVIRHDYQKNVLIIGMSCTCIYSFNVFHAFVLLFLS